MFADRPAVNMPSCAQKGNINQNSLSHSRKIVDPSSPSVIKGSQDLDCEKQKSRFHYKTSENNSDAEGERRKG